MKLSNLKAVAVALAAVGTVGTASAAVVLDSSWAATNTYIPGLHEFDLNCCQAFFLPGFATGGRTNNSYGSFEYLSQAVDKNDWLVSFFYNGNNVFSKTINTASSTSFSGNYKNKGLYELSWTPFVQAVSGGFQTGERFTIKAETIPAVPEPQTYAMLLAGLGIVGYISRRRRTL